MLERGIVLPGDAIKLLWGIAPRKLKAGFRGSRVWEKQWMYLLSVSWKQTVNARLWIPWGIRFSA